MLNLKIIIWFHLPVISLYFGTYQNPSHTSYCAKCLTIVDVSSFQTPLLWRSKGYYVIDEDELKTIQLAGKIGSIWLIYCYETNPKFLYSNESLQYLYNRNKLL